MYPLIWDEPFREGYQEWMKAHPRYAGISRERIRLLASDPFHPSLKMHQLSGRLTGMYAARITLELRIIFRLTPDPDPSLILIGFADHTEVF